MKLKKFLEDKIKENPEIHQELIDKALELQSIDIFLMNVFGVELDIKVKEVKQKQPRGIFYGEAFFDKAIKELFNKKQ